MPVVHGCLLQMTFQGVHHSRTAEGGVEAVENEGKYGKSVYCIGFFAI